MKYEKIETVLKGLDIVVVEPKGDSLKNKEYNVKTLNLNSLESNIFSPLEIPNIDEINKHQEQLTKQSELTGIPNHILVQFNNDMNKQDKEININTFKEWAESH